MKKQKNYKSGHHFVTQKKGICQMGLLFLIATSATSVLLVSTAHAERLFPDVTPGRIESQFPSAGIDAEWRNGVLMKSNSSDLPKFERITPTAISGIRAYAKTSLTGRLFARTNIFAAGIYQNETETAEGPPNSATQMFGAYGSSSAFSLITENQIELIAGADIKGETEQSIKRNNSGLESETSTAAYFLWRPHFGFSKKGSSWTAGAFYSMSDEKEVEVKTRVLDDTRTEKTFATLSPKFGGYFEAKIGGTMSLGTELDFILGSSGQLKVDEKQVYDDSYRAHAHIVFEYGGKESLWISLTHETLSYADQDFVSFENIPYTDLETTYTFSSGLYLGLIVTYSEDKQSTEEINRTFQVYGISLKTGLKFPKN